MAALTVHGKLSMKAPSGEAARWFLVQNAEVFSDKTMAVYGGFGPMCGDYCDDLWLYDFSDGSWTEMIELGSSKHGPGKRFKFSSVVLNDKLYVFGGFRLWHGFAHANSEENDWSEVDQYPLGGYLNDLWVYDKVVNAWTNITEKVECPTDPKLLADALLNEIEVECAVTWPPARAGHTSVVFDNAIFVHGGYRTFFPYPTTSSAGAGRGTLGTRNVGFTPYPTHPYYLSDLWKFNISTGGWTRVVADSDAIPEPRTDHSLIVANDVFVLFGGYLSNYYYDDTWQYNATSCTDDLEARRLPHSGNYAAYAPTASLPDNPLNYYFIAETHYGTTTFSVLTEPTRGTTQERVLVEQARRQAPGWDGCRDRHDGREDLPAELQWEHPSQRSGHMSVYHEGFEKVFVFGGYGYEREENYHDAVTFAAASLGDLWQYDLNNCIKNCSLHGACLAGNCRCDDGYYGEDCSNSTCPGSYCVYDDPHQTQVCNHCCFSGFEHTNNDSYVENVQKFPCATDNVHYSNGVCDGFGKCICKPPFIGDDCSIRDCGYNCSGHGYCSVEFPNSRCMCDEGWYGKYCDAQMCLNNCSYPNGECMNGSCYCAMVYEPYNNTLEYFPLMGDDCSFLIPFAGAVRAPSVVMAIVVATILTLALSYGGGYGQSRHGLMVEEEGDEDLYEGFNFSIDLAPPQTASTNNYMASSYGAPASRGGYNPPGTAFRMFDPMGEARKGGAAPALVEKTENSPKEVAKELERTVNALIEQSAELISKEQYEEALHLAKDAGRKERAFNKHCELNGLADLLNIDLTYAVFFNLANAYHLNGLWKEAIQSYTPIVKNKQYAQGGRLRVNMGNIYFEQQQYPTAIRMYRMALDQIPNTSKEVRYKIKRNIGAAQIKLGHYQDAAATFEDIMEGNADFQSGFNLIICYYAIGEHDKMRRGFTNLISIPMEGMSEEEEEESGLANESKHGDDDHTSSKEHLHSLKADGLKAEIRARRKKAMEYILVAAKLCAPALDKKDWLAGFTWVIDALKQENHEGLASEVEICKAHWFLKEKEFDKAIEVLKAFEKKDPAHKAMAATNLSYLYFVEGDTAQADKYASLAVRHQRYNAKALVNKGNCLYVKNECERAKELFLEAIGVEADCIEAIYNLGLVNIKMGVLNEALQAFEKLHSIVPTNAEVLYQIANLHDIMGNYRQAAKWFNILLSCFGGSDKRDRNAKNVADPGVLARIGQIFNKDDDETQAFHYHLESYRHFPINLDVISWLGVWYVKSELYEKAIQFFERASQIQPNEVKWRLMVTSCYRRMGAYQKAMVLYEQIHQDYPENLECLRYLVAICKDLGQRCDGFQAKLAKLERDSAVNSNMPPPQQQQAPPVGNGHSSRNSNADDNDEPRAPLSYQRQPQESQYQRQDSGRGASLYGNGTGTPEPRTRDSEDNGRSEYVAPPQMQTMVTPTTARAPQPQKTARASKHEDTDDWGDADVGNLLGD
uniref:EGF-like domain-containing protein n=1 Tax=Phytophthora ramorum TaxID=164328 RepID=H3GSZ4_PHYRM